MHYALQQYIETSWVVLKRSPLDIAPDPKVDEGKAYLYVPPVEAVADIEARIAERRRLTQDATPIEVRPLPRDEKAIREHGVLYLPNDYIVPGGRFNEMYGWDSFWIVLGLLHHKKDDLARGMVENLFYEIENYGSKILNANRTYYLTRSQPPLLAPMVTAVAATLDGDRKVAFLRRGEAALAANYKKFWRAKRHTRATGLFHYGAADQGKLGLCPEVVFGERDANFQSHYDKVVAHLRHLPTDDASRRRFYSASGDTLTKEAIAGDRAMRESGFDPSMRHGCFGLEAIDYNPVCLNVLLYVQLRTLAEINRALGQGDAVEVWRREAARLNEAIQKYLWNEQARLFGDYNHAQKKPSEFPFLTSAYPLWAGIATPAQAEHFRKNLSLFEAPYGLMSTPVRTGCQWDGPYMWAPLVYFAVEGLRAYGFDEDARRVAQKFIGTVARVFDETGTIYEKFNALNGTRETDGIKVGYKENVTGFGWTNATASHLWNWIGANAVVA